MKIIVTHPEKGTEEITNPEHLVGRSVLHVVLDPSDAASDVTDAMLHQYVYPRMVQPTTQAPPLKTAIGAAGLAEAILSEELIEEFYLLVLKGHEFHSGTIEGCRYTFCRRRHDLWQAAVAARQPIGIPAYIERPDPSFGRAVSLSAYETMAESFHATHSTILDFTNPMKNCGHLLCVEAIALLNRMRKETP